MMAAVSSSDYTGKLTTLAYSTQGKVFYFTYDADGRRATHTLPTTPTATTATCTYDNANNLTGIQYAKGGVLTSVGYAYDAANNRLTRTDNAAASAEIPGVDTLTYNVSNEMLSLNTTTYGYDQNGNRVLKVDANGNTAYTYDDEDRLIGVDTPGGQVITYTYDPLGRRIEKNVNGTITRYFYDMEDILLEYDQSGAVTARYFHGPGIDEPLAVEKSGTMYYYHTDGLGSIVALTGSTGTIMQSYQYDAFGNMLNGTPTITQPYAYTGREYDPETGLYYYRARHYDAVAGRFLQRDPIGFAGGDVNLYGYGKNNPINRVDPLGLYWFRQPSQTPGVVGRRDTLVPPLGLVSEIIEQYVPAGYTFGETHDSFVDAVKRAGIPDSLVNIPSMIPMYVVALITEVLRTLGILDQPTPQEKSTPCK